MADLNQASLDDVKQFHAMYYVPNNAVLCITGDLEYEKTKSLVKKYFSDIPEGEQKIFRPSEMEPKQMSPVRATISDNVQLPALMIGFHVPDQNDRDYYALDMLASILSGGRSSRLYQRLVYKDRLAQSATSFAYGLELPGMFIVRATAQMGKKLEDVERVILEEIKNVQDELVKEQELQKAKNRQESSYINQLASVGSRADQLNSYHIFQKNAGNINTELQRVLNVSREDMQRVAKKYLTSANSTVVYCVPKPKSSDSSKSK
jgi:predicted Zn-dependent peptidase